MKHYLLAATFFIGALFTSCSEKETVSENIDEKIIESLPFKNFNLNTLEDFRETSKNWQIIGNAYVDQAKKGVLIPTEGTGLLANIQDKENRQHLFTKFEHGDIELELDVMMPISSNSGLYFQGRYEIQLLDSWGEENPESGDIGGVYKRWDDSREEGKRGFDGVAPNTNACKAPGLWQHFKIIFHAPTFDASGKKVKNAWFEKVWLNGKLIHENVELSGPTRASAFNDEVPLAPFMIQGDHGQVAFRNMQYKLYNSEKVGLKNLNLKEYEGNKKIFKASDDLTLLRELKVDELSAAIVEGNESQRLLKYTGELEVPVSGDYLLELRINNGGGFFLINNDTLIDRNADFDLYEPGFATVNLQKGSHPFTFIYNKHRSDHKGFTLQVEGPNMQKYFLNPPESVVLKSWQNPTQIMLESSDEVVMQRSFLVRDEQKRTHCISVSTPEKIHYSFDIASGSLLQVWWGPFLNTTGMWFSRGGEQTAFPAGIEVLIHGDRDFAALANDSSKWAEHNFEDSSFKSLGYTIDPSGHPILSHQLNDAIITNKFTPSDDLRGLTRTISSKSSKAIWHKIGKGEVIEELPDGTFLINDKSYFVDFKNSPDFSPIIRTVGNTKELIVKIPSGTQKLNYNIIW